MNIVGGIFASRTLSEADQYARLYSTQDVEGKVTGKKGLFKNLRGKLDGFKESLRYSKQIKVKENYITRMRSAMHRYRMASYTEQLKELEKELKIAQDSRASQLVINNISSQIASLKQQMKIMDSSIIDTIQQRVANMKESRKRTRGSDEYKNAEDEYKKLQEERRKKGQTTNTQQENAEQKTENQQIDDGLSQTKGEEIQPVTENNSTPVAEDSMPSNSGSTGTEEVQTEKDTTLDEQLQEALKKVGKNVENIMEKEEQSTKEEEEKIARSAKIDDIDKSLMINLQNLGENLNKNLMETMRAYQQGMVAVTAEAFKGYQEVIAELENSLNNEIIARQDFQEKYKNAAKRSIALADKNDTLDKELNAKTVENENLSKKNIELNQKLDQANEENHVLNDQLSKEQDQTNSLKASLALKEEEYKSVTGALRESKVVIEEQNKEIASLRAYIENINAQSERLQQIINDFSISLKDVDKMSNNEIVDGEQKTFSGKSGK